MPLFDRIDETPGEMPAHLQGKTPKEVNDYWAERERQLRAQPAENPPAAPPARTPAATPAGMSAGQAATLIQGAKMVAQQGKDHWTRFLPEVEAIMSQMTPDQQMDANMWNTVYDKVVGMHVNDLVKEAKDAALHPPSMESSSPATPPTEPRQLSAGEMKVVEGLRRAGATALRKDANGVLQQVPFDSEAYLAADGRRKEGTWPLTFNNY